MTTGTYRLGNWPYEAGRFSWWSNGATSIVAAVRRPDFVLFADTCEHVAAEPVAAESACASHRPTEAVWSCRHSFGRRAVRV